MPRFPPTLGVVSDLGSGLQDHRLPVAWPEKPPAGQRARLPQLAPARMEQVPARRP